MSTKHGMRNFVELRFTSSPQDLGYGNTPRTDEWQTAGKPDLRGTPRQILKRWPDLRRRVGLNGGTYHAVALRWVQDKSEVTLSELRNVCDNAEMRNKSR